MATIPQFDVNALEQISKVLGNAASGSELSNIFRQCNIDDILGYGDTKCAEFFRA